MISLLSVLAAAVLLIIGLFSPRPTTGLGAGMSLDNLGYPGLPAEFEPQSFLMFAAQGFAQEQADTLADVLAGASTRIPTYVLVNSDSQSDAIRTQLLRRRTNLDQVRFLMAPHDSHWIRDYGPQVIRQPQGGAIILDPTYVFNGNRRFDRDDRVPGIIAKLTRLPAEPVGIIADGGNLLSNGMGLVVTTTNLRQANLNRGVPADQVFNTLREKYLAQQIVELVPLAGEWTGHVDIFATFCSPRDIIVAAMDPADDPVNARILNDNAGRLARVQTPDGDLRVHRLRQPRPRKDGVFPSYTNVIYANGVVLVPQYPRSSAALDRSAIELFQRLMPGWRVVGVNCDRLIEEHGALRCIALNMPLIERPQGAPQP